MAKISSIFGFQVGLKYNESVVIRVTGCPNGCARPYMAELGLVGDGPNSYQVFQMLCSSARIFLLFKLRLLRKHLTFYSFCCLCSNRSGLEEHPIKPQ